MLINTPTSQAFESAFDDQVTPVAADALDMIFDGDGADGAIPTEDAGAILSHELDAEGLAAIETSPSTEQQPTEENLADRLWWDKCEILEKISRCSEIIENTESEINGYKNRIKSASEILKGEQAQLAMYSSQLREILAGRPLPKNPNAAATAEDDKESDDELDEPGQPLNWRDTATRDLLDGIKGMGPKKLDAICAIAQTVGQLEDLRGQASREFKAFKDVLPKGCGEELCSAIEEKLLDYLAKITTDDDADGEPASDPDAELRDDVAEALLPITRQ